MLKLRVGSHKDLNRYYMAFRNDFHEKEMISKLSIHKAMLKGEMELLLFYDEETGLDYAYALTVKRGVYGYVLLKYFGVLPFYREHGIGIAAMRLINKHYSDTQGILAELTVFDDEEDQTLRKLRKFFSRFGYVKIDSDYRIGGSPVELMVKPINGSVEIERVAHRMIIDFYQRIMGASEMFRMIDIKAVKK